MRRFAVAALFFAALATLWQLMVVSGQWSPVLLPSPLSVVEYLSGAVSDGSLTEAAAVVNAGVKFRRRAGAIFPQS